MPCDSGPPAGWEQERLDAATRAACEMAKFLTNIQRDHLSAETLAWVKQHEEIDRQRLAREAESLERTLEQRRAYFKTWRDKRVADGKCWSCCKHPAGGPNGTKTRCGLCAEKNRQNAIIRWYRLHPNRPEPKPIPTFTPVLVKREPRPARRFHITWLELSSGGSNT